MQIHGWLASVEPGRVGPQLSQLLVSPAWIRLRCDLLVLTRNLKEVGPDTSRQAGRPTPLDLPHQRRQVHARRSLLGEISSRSDYPRSLRRLANLKASNPIRGATAPPHKKDNSGIHVSSPPLHSKLATRTIPKYPKSSQAATPNRTAAARPEVFISQAATVASSDPPLLPTTVRLQTDRGSRKRHLLAEYRCFRAARPGVHPR